MTGARGGVLPMTRLRQRVRDAGADDALHGDVLRMLGWLDALVRDAVACAHGTREPEAGMDPFRGLHISPAEVARLLQQPPGNPLLASRGGSAHAERVPRPGALEPLAAACGLDDFDIAVLLIAAAPELDLRYERLYAYLQDDVGKKRPTVDLALNLLCGSVAVKLRRRDRFAGDAPLIRHGLLHLQGDGAALGSSRLAHSLHLDDQVLGLLLGDRSLDRRLVPGCRWLDLTELADAAADPTIAMESTQALVRKHADQGEPLGLFLQGPAAADLDAHARALARAAGLPLLEADLSRLAGASAFAGATLALITREVRLKGVAVHLRHFEALQGPEHAADREALVGCIDGLTGLWMLSGASHCAPLQGAGGRLVPVHCEPPDEARRRAAWAGALRTQGCDVVDPRCLDAVARQYRLSADQIHGAAAHAVFLAGARGGAPSIDHLTLAARAQTRHVLASLAHRVESTRGFADLVLPDDAQAQLREICARYVHRHRVFEEWGFGRKVGYGKGLAALFAGPSGTGKTMAAEVVANELQLDLYRIDLARVVSKYIGETEQNMDRIFTAAEAANAILLFDEADALFGKRSEVKDAHDRYANLEVSYLLQKMEAYDGITVLATNMRQNIDEAFVRRFAAIVSFAAPDRLMRQRLWAGAWPAATPLAPDVDFDRFAAVHRFTGANIRNVALLASMLAAGEGRAVHTAHLAHAAAREEQKLGRSAPAAESVPGAGR